MSLITAHGDGVAELPAEQEGPLPVRGNACPQLLDGPSRSAGLPSAPTNGAGA